MHAFIFLNLPLSTSIFLWLHVLTCNALSASNQFARSWFSIVWNRGLQTTICKSEGGSDPPRFPIRRAVPFPKMGQKQWMFLEIIVFIRF